MKMIASNPEFSNGQYTPQRKRERCEYRFLNGFDSFTPRVWEALRIPAKASNVQEMVPGIKLPVTLEKYFNFCGPWSPHLGGRPVGLYDPYAPFPC